MGYTEPAGNTSYTVDFNKNIYSNKHSRALFLV